MPANKFALLRYRIIDKCIRNKYKPHPSKEELRQACEEALYNSFHERVSESTIEKDIYAMRNEEGLGYLAPIKYSREYDGYYYTEEDYSIDDIPLNDNDIEAIKFAALTLSQFRSISVFSDFENAIDKLMGRISISRKLEDDAIQQFVSFESSPPAKGTEFLSDLLEAIKNRIKVDLRYKSYKEDKETERTIHPYLLKEYRNRWYVLGLDEKDNRIKTFGLDRISNIKLLLHAFVLVKDFDPLSFFKYSFGITAIDGKPQEIVLEFTTAQGNYIKSQPLHHSQKIIEDDNNKLIISMEVQSSPELIMQLMAFGNKVKILKPKSLALDVIGELKNAINNYKD